MYELYTHILFVCLFGDPVIRKGVFRNYVFKGVDFGNWFF